MVDTSGYLPRDVAASCDALADTGRYCFVSSVSVYADLSAPVDEGSAVAELGELSADEVTDESYGALKALCERAVVDAFGDRALVVRPGLIVGPHDPTGRFTYWPHRVARGGEVLAPAPAESPLQAIDVRDLGAWIVSACELGTSGVYNATHPGFTWAELLDACLEAAATEAHVTWVASEFLAEHEVGEWMELPLWVASPAFDGIHRVDVEPRARGGARLPAARRDGARRPSWTPSRRTVRVSPPSVRPSSSRSGMAAGKDYSGTPLSQKLGAKPGVGVVVYFTHDARGSRAALRRR